jgi:hypothetical protein
MTEGRKQHYVPRYYFRLFIGNDIVNVYDLKNKRFYKGSCNDLCAENYFYSRDTEIEKIFSPLERKLREVLKKIIDSQSIGGLTGEEYYLLCFFFVFQNVRTAKVKKDSEDYINLIFKNMSKSLLEKNIGKFPWLTKEYVDTHEMPTISGPTHLMTLWKSMSTGPLLISDLTPLILVNKTGQDLIFSDSPVVFYNGFFNDKNGEGSVAQTSPGLQIFCPLNTKTILILYDPKFYRFGNMQGNVVEISSEEDVISLNALQFFNCKECVFFVDEAQSEAISILHSSLEDRIKDDYYEIENYVIPGAPTGFDREFILTGKRDIDYNLSLSFMTFNSDAGAVGPFRDDNLVQKAMAIDDEIMKIFKIK